MERTEAAIRDMVQCGVDVAAVATICRVTFRQVQEVKAALEAEAMAATRVRAATAMRTPSPALEDAKARHEKRMALRKRMRDHAKEHKLTPSGIRECHAEVPETEATYRE